MKIYKCLIAIFNKPELYISATGKKKGFLYDYWILIKKQLKKEDIQFKEEITYSRDYQDLLNKIAVKQYDILIGPSWITSKRLEKVNFTFPIFFFKPKILYNKKNDKINYKLYLLKIIEIWIKPLIIFLCITLIISLFLSFNPFYKKNNDGFFINFYYVFISFLGQPTGLLFNTNNKSSYYFRTLFLIFIFIVVLYIKTSIFSDSVLFIQHSNQLENNIQTSKIMVDSKAAAQIIINMGGKPYLVNTSDIMSEYLHQYTKVDGMFSGDKYMAEYMKKGFDINFSNIYVGSLVVGFAINKENQELLNQINKSIILLRDKKKISNLCQDYFEEKITVSC